MPSTMVMIQDLVTIAMLTINLVTWLDRKLQEGIAMPKATTNLEETERLDLKSCEGGFVLLRRMTWGQILHRRQMSSMMKVSTRSRSLEGEMQMANEAVTRFEFGACIVDHNLFLDEDETQKIDFKNPQHFVQVHPKIAEEIDRKITEMNTFDEGEEEGNS